MNYDRLVTDLPPQQRRPVVPPLSTRTLQHPSFLPLYMAAAVSSPVLIPSELFYTDATMAPGRRIQNRVRKFRAFDSFQLNTPPPVMSACVAPPSRPDPFRRGAHPVRGLGSSAWRRNGVCGTGPSSRVILQLTQEEDQAVTNLLKLHHHDPLQREEALNDLHMDSSSASEPPEDNIDSFSDCTDDTLAEESEKLSWSDMQWWSDSELEAADTLSSGFNTMEVDELRGLEHGGQMESGKTDGLHEEYPAASSESRSSVLLSGMKGRELSDSEGDAVHVLLSLRDM